MKIGFVSLGCSKNLIDTEIMLKLLVDAGYEIVDEDIHADIMIINTCAFIQSAKQEAIENILDVAWLKENRDLKGIVVCGCLAERYKTQVFDELPEVDALIGVGSINQIVEAVKSVEERLTINQNIPKYASFSDKEALKLGGDRVITTPEYMAYLKIAEGCDNRCSYCAIPGIRGSFRSRTMESVISEAKTLADMGVKELNVIAQDTTRYGEDIYGRLALPELLRELVKIDGIRWIRLLYCYPERITDELIQVIKTEPKIVKYIDMPIQHYADAVLKRMNRRDTSASVFSIVEKLRREIDGIVLRTTVLVGFPGETKADFAALCEFLKEAKFERLGAFAYSQEEDTPAHDMDGQLDEKTKSHRADVIMRSQNTIIERYHNTWLGRSLEVLVEGYDKAAATYYGRSYADAPDIDGKVYFEGEKGIKEGEFVTVKITEVLDYDLYGKVTNQ